MRYITDGRPPSTRISTASTWNSSRTAAKLIPDLGYGEHAAEGDRPAVWTKNTLAHATVVVDGRRQDTQGPGRLEQFVRARDLTWVQVDAPETYHHTSEYRRTLALIEVGKDARYVLDVFRVAGGTRHDYSLHGFEGEFTADDIALTPPQQQGTLAGPDVPYGAIYDDDGLTDPLKKGRSYYTYRGGGYSYLYDAQRGKPTAAWSSTWRDPKTGIGLNTTFLPSDEAIVAQGDPTQKTGKPEATHLGAAAQRRGQARPAGLWLYTNPIRAPGKSTPSNNWMQAVIPSR